MAGSWFDRVRYRLTVRAARDPSSARRSQAIALLGGWPYEEDAFRCLATIVEGEGGRTIYGREALEAICRLRCDQATRFLRDVLGREGLGREERSIVIGALLEPHRGHAVNVLAAHARRECGNGHFPEWFETAMLAIGTPEALGHLDELLPHILRLAVKSLAGTDAEAATAKAAEAYLERREGTAAAAALLRLRRALIGHYLRVASGSRDHDRVAAAHAALEASDLPEAREALGVFRSQPSRRLARCLPSASEDPWWPGGQDVEGMTESIFSSVFGQPPGEEEQAVLRAAEEAERRRLREARQVEEQERRERVFNDLLALGEEEDVASYVRQCLGDPGRAPGVLRLADYLGQQDASPLAATLARLIGGGDRTALEAFLIADGSNAAIAALEGLGAERMWERLLENELAAWTGGGRTVRDATVRLCERYPDEMSAALVKLLRDEEPTSRRLPALAETLARCGDLAVRRVRHLLSDPRWPVRRQAVSFLAVVPGDRARRALENFLAVEADSELRAIAERGLGR